MLQVSLSPICRKNVILSQKLHNVAVVSLNVCEIGPVFQTPATAYTTLKARQWELDVQQLQTLRPFRAAAEGMQLYSEGYRVDRWTDQGTGCSLCIYQVHLH